MGIYPNIIWPQFAVCNDDATTAFEDMCRRIFEAEFLKGQKIPHSDHNTPGVEVLPILEPPRNDGLSQKRISFQAKYVDQVSTAYSEFKKSAKQTVKHHKCKLDLTGERFVAGLRLNPIHLDALILAQRENATFLCDDLFFRKIATWMNLRNLNIVSLIKHYAAPDYVTQFIIELSKTNYIYIPFLSMARNDDEAHELYNNILTGEKKQIYYKDLLDRYVEVRDRILREFFGD